MAVLDASVVVAALNRADESHVGCVQWVQSALLRGTMLTAPAILWPEAASGTRRHLDNPGLSGDFVGRWLVSAGVELRPASPPLCARASEIVSEHGLRGCDAIYVALAEQLGEPLVTLDRQQAERGRLVVAVVSLGEPPEAS